MWKHRLRPCVISLWLLALMLFSLTFTYMTDNAQARSGAAMTQAELEFLKGVDTLIFEVEYLTKGYALIQIPTDKLRLAIDSTLDEIVNDQKWITIDPLWVLDNKGFKARKEELKKPNVAYLSITISAREVDDNEGKKQKLGTVNIDLYLRQDEDHNSTKLPKIFPAIENRISIPFVISDDEQENLKRISEAVKILMAYLPEFMRCANKIEYFYCQEDKNPFEEKQIP